MKIVNNKHLKKIKRVRIAENRDLANGLRLDRNEKVDNWPSNFLKNVIAKQPKSFFSTYPEISDLYMKIAKHNKIKVSQILITSGIDGSIRNLLELLVKPKDSIGVFSPTYAMYQVYADIFNLKLHKINYDSNYNINKADLSLFLKG